MYTGSGRKFKKQQIFIMLFTIFTMLLSPLSFAVDVHRAHAEASQPTLTLQNPIREWIMDEANGYIYAVSQEANSLLFIHLSDLQVEKQVTLGPGPSDLVQSGDKLYVALSGKKSIAIVDIAQKEVVGSIATSIQPYELAIDDNKLFYAEYDSKVAVYNLTTQAEALLDPGLGIRFNSPDLAVDPTNHILFVGDSSSSASNLYSYSTATLQPLSRTKYENYGFNRAIRKVLVDGDQVFFAGYRFKNTDLTSIQGTYQHDAIYVAGDKVFTVDAGNSGLAAPSHSYVFDRNGFTQIAELPVASRRVLVDSHNRIISYTGSDFWNSNLPNVIQIISMPTVTPPNSWQSDGQKLTLDKSVTDIVYSSDGANLFAISSETNQLMRIRTSDMTVQESRNIGSNPSSIYIDHDDLYISFASATQITRVNTIAESTVNGAVYSWDTGNFVNQVVYGDQKVIYTASNMSAYAYPGIRVIDTALGTKTNYATDLNSPGRMILSPEDHVLYFGGTEKYSTNQVIKFNLNDFSRQAVSQSYTNPLGMISMNGSDLYFASKRLDQNTLLPVSTGTGYSGAAIIAANGANIFAKDSVWNRDSYTMQYHLPFITKNVLTLPNGQIMALADDGKTIEKFASMQALYDRAPEFNPPSLQATNVNFSDYDPVAEEVSGQLYWESTPGTSTITGYTIYFLDQNYNRIDNKIAEIPFKSDVSNYQYVFSEVSIPKGAKYIGVYTKNDKGESSSAATVLLTDYLYTSGDNSGSNPYFDFKFEDQDSTRGHIHPMVSWFTPFEYNYSSYQLTFADSSGKKLGSTSDVTKHESQGITYQFEIDESAVPAGAAFVDLRPKDLNGNTSTEMYRMQIFDKTMGSPMITGTNSSIPVPNLQLLRSGFDNDLSPGSLGGSIIFYDNSLDNTATSYDLYFLDANNAKLQSIAEIIRGNFVDPHIGMSNPTYEINLTKGTIIPFGAQRIGIYGKNSQGEGTSAYYFAILDNIDFDAGKSYFEDQDVHANKIDGVLRWIPVIDETNIRNYTVKFVDTDMTPVGSPLAPINKGQKQYNVIIKDSQIPAGASALRVSAMNLAGDEIVVGTYNLTDNIAGEPVSTLPMDPANPDSIFSSIMWDYDAEEGELGGVLNFSSLNYNRNTLHYDVYFVGDSWQKVQPIISIPSNHFGLYSTSIPMNTRIPSGATQIAIYAVSAAGMSSPFAFPIIDHGQTAPLTPDQIQITNNKAGTPDTITVTGLKPNDFIRVYSSLDSNNSILFQNVEADKTSVTFTVPQLGTMAGNLYFAILSGNNTQSVKVEKAYAAEPVTPAPASGGGGGGGGGGSKSSPVRDAEGRMTYKVQPAHVDMLIDLANGAKPQLILDATAEEHIDITTVSFAADIVQIAAEKGKPIVIKTNGVQLLVPVNAWTINDSGNTVMLKVSSTDAPSTGSMRAVSPVMEFTLTENNAPITAFNSPLEAVFQYDPSKVKDPSNLGIYWLDESTNTWTYMGGKVNVDGTITASLPHFSKYAVLEKVAGAAASTTFADIQGHWAQKEIEQLISKQIVDGMDANSFQPNNNMTRAQFVTILKKALNLPVQADEANQSFADVAADSWYKDAVYAAYTAKIVGGTGDSTFAPEENVTREQLAVMVVNAYLNATGKKLSDIAAVQTTEVADASSISAWAKPYVAAATTLGLLNGMDDTHFAPAENSTRAQVATVVVRMLNQIQATK